MLIYSPGIPSALHIKRIMIFIDGGYFRNILLKYLVGDQGKEPQRIARALSLISDNVIRYTDFKDHELEIIRIYYYDGLVDTSDETYDKGKQFFEDLKSNYFSRKPIELKFGRLIKGENGKYRQKGVDVLLSIDLVVKAFQDHYDLALLIAGDDDFVDAVKVVKDLTGKRIIGLYKPEETSPRLIDCLDYALPKLPDPFFKDLPL
jgi:uncharacterized LabA/DUF88 family protein